MHDRFSHYSLQLPSPEGSYPHFKKEELLIRSTLDFERDGVWYKEEHRWVAIADVQCRDMWKQKSLEYAKKQIAQSKPLYRVHLELAEPDESYKYTIGDGIHKINALKSLSFTHVLAWIPSRVVHTKPPLPPDAPL